MIPNSIVTTLPTLPPTPPPDGSAADEAAAAHEKEKQQQLNDRRQWREDALLDFAAFESSIVRIQLLLTSNIKERERYAADKLKIQATAQDVRDNTGDLRVQLEEAQKKLALRKEYDELAEKIMSNRLLRPREDQHANLDKLNAEILELERESQEYAQTWAERRQQFGKIIEEGMQLRRLIRDEKEEVERREGMEEREGSLEEGEGGFQRSALGTPRHVDGGATPAGGAPEQERQRPGGLLGERHATPAGGRSPLPHSDRMTEDKGESQASEDTDMAEDGEVSGDSDLAGPPAEGLVVENARNDDEQDDGSRRMADHMDMS